MSNLSSTWLGREIRGLRRVGVSHGDPLAVFVRKIEAQLGLDDDA